ncbi:AI-2E family transporter [Lederbergia sp. NSJ-179]|uniref:AI-2E family transporter n=1 Tax=Lederbergia sp. NSJ-179 TaxID=2931402 RepID=UPI001FD0360C|nr:AI-2E family transporter [Lederbergia sp. NSJ-179]MCJ7841784.1 AI-2E family transporter [Lederbergia sp. NSJ-179]
MKERHLQLILRLSIVLLIFLILYCFLLIKPLWTPILKAIFVGVMPFLLSGFIAYLLHPIVVRLEKMGMNRTLAISSIYIIFFAGIGYGLYMGIPFFIKQLKDFSDQLPIFIRHYREWIHHLEASTSHYPDGIQDQIDKRIDDVERWFNKWMEKSVTFLVKLIDYLVVIAVIPFISFYMLKDVSLLKRATWYIAPKKWRANGQRFLEAVNDSLGGYIRGQLLVCIFVAVLSMITLAFLGVEYPVMLGLFIGVTNIIPYFGLLIGLIPTLAIALLSSVKLAIFATIAMLIIQFIEGNLLSPFIVGKSLHMHPLFIIAALVIGGEVGGVIGMIISVPILAVIKIAILHSRDYLIRTRQS